MRWELRLLATGDDGCAVYAPRFCDGCGARMLERPLHDVHVSGKAPPGDDFGWIGTSDTVLICPNNCKTCGKCLRILPAGRQCPCRTI